MNTSSARNSILRRTFFAAATLLTVTGSVYAYPGKVIIGTGITTTELLDEGYLMVTDLSTLRITGVSKAAIVLKVTTDQGRTHQVQFIDGDSCTVSYNANGHVQSAECDLTDLPQ